MRFLILLVAPFVWFCSIAGCHRTCRDRRRRQPTPGLTAVAPTTPDTMPTPGRPRSHRRRRARCREGLRRASDGSILAVRASPMRAVATRAVTTIIVTTPARPVTEIFALRVEASARLVAPSGTLAPHGPARPALRAIARQPPQERACAPTPVEQREPLVARSVSVRRPPSSSIAVQATRPGLAKSAAAERVHPVVPAQRVRPGSPARNGPRGAITGRTAPPPAEPRESRVARATAMMAIAASRACTWAVMRTVLASPAAATVSRAAMTPEWSTYVPPGSSAGSCRSRSTKFVLPADCRASPAVPIPANCWTPRG